MNFDDINWDALVRLEPDAYHVAARTGATNCVFTTFKLDRDRTIPKWPIVNFPAWDRWAVLEAYLCVQAWEWDAYHRESLILSMGRYVHAAMRRQIQDAGFPLSVEFRGDREAADYFAVALLALSKAVSKRREFKVEDSLREDDDGGWRIYPDGCSSEPANLVDVEIQLRKYLSRVIKYSMRNFFKKARLPTLHLRHDPSDHRRDSDVEAREDLLGTTTTNVVPELKDELLAACAHPNDLAVLDMKCQEFDLTHQEIADRLSMSRYQVDRIVKQIRRTVEEGLGLRPGKYGRGRRTDLN